MATQTQTISEPAADVSVDMVYDDVTLLASAFVLHNPNGHPGTITLTRPSVADTVYALIATSAGGRSFPAPANFQLVPTRDKFGVIVASAPPMLPTGYGIAVQVTG